MEAAREDVTTLLGELAKGDQEAASKLIPLVYEELRRIANRYMRRELRRRPDHTLQSTALVHEAYIKLVRQRSVDWAGRAHFFAIAANIMRRILIDHARGYRRGKHRGAHKVVPLDKALVLSPGRSDELLRLDEALKRLIKLDARQGKIVELRFFGGLTVEETAKLLNISPKTVKREWSVAKAWLYGDLRQSHEHVARELGNS